MCHSLVIMHPLYSLETRFILGEDSYSSVRCVSVSVSALEDGTSLSVLVSFFLSLFLCESIIMVM